MQKDKFIVVEPVEPKLFCDSGAETEAVISYSGSKAPEAKISF